MLAYSELIELRKMLSRDEIALDKAKESYWRDYKPSQRAWQTKDWKERRNKIIKDKCEICGSTETLTLQHSAHPRKYHEYKKDVEKEYAQLYIETNTIVDKSELTEHINRNYDYVPVPLCPNCKSRNPNKRTRKLPEYFCTECRHEFDEPFYNSTDTLVAIFYKDEQAVEVRDKCFISKNQWKNKNRLSEIKYWLQRERAQLTFRKTIERETFLNYLDEIIEYLSFKGTITACKRCASSFDLRKMELCPECKTHYKGIQYPVCIQCLPDEKRKAALDKIQFGKDWQAMHETLGID